MFENLESLLGPDTCRLCLKTGRSPTPVSNENLEGSLMAIKIDILTSVKVAPSDKVCPMCRINVKNFYDFRIMCVQSDARIKGFAAKVASSSQEDFSVTKSDHAIRSYKRVRRRGEAEVPTGETAKPIENPVQGTVDLFKSTAGLFKLKAESGNSAGGLFKLKTKPYLMRTEDAFKGLKRPLILSAPRHSQAAKNPKPNEKSQSSKPEPRKSAEDPLQMLQYPFLASDEFSMTTENSLSSSEDALSAAGDSQSLDKDPISTSDNLSSARDPLSSARDPLSSTTDPLSSATDPLSSATDPLSSTTDPLSSATDPLSSVSDSLLSNTVNVSLAIEPLSPDGETHNITVEPLIPDHEDAEDGPEDGSDAESNSQGGFTVKIENMLEDESISDTQSNYDDNASDGGSEGKQDTETDSSKLINEKDTDLVDEGPTMIKIKEELPDYEPEETADDSRDEENLADIEIKPEEIILPEVKREPGDSECDELFMEAECDEEEYSREEVSFSEEAVEEIKRVPKRDDTENLEVLVDPLMVMDEDHDAQMESRLNSLSPVLGNGKAIKNGKLPLPALNGARSDKQRGLDFVKKLLRHNDNSAESKTTTTPKPAAAPAPAAADTAERPYTCASCGIRFAYYKSYMKHKESHRGIACNLCTDTFRTHRELHIHMKTHNEKSYSCDRCYRSFPSKERRHAHYSVHTGDKPHVCDLCKKSFAYKSSFVFHMRKQHGEIIAGGTFLRCPQCPTEWNSTSELKNHMEMHESVESDTTSFTCPICALSFPSKSILNVHARIHQKPLKEAVHTDKYQLTQVDSEIFDMSDSEDYVLKNYGQYYEHNLHRTYVHNT